MFERHVNEEIKLLHVISCNFRSRYRAVKRPSSLFLFRPLHLRRCPADRRTKIAKHFLNDTRYRKFPRHILDTYAYTYPSLFHSPSSRSLISVAYSGRLNFHNNCERAKRSPCHSTRQYPGSRGRFNGFGPLKLAHPFSDIYSNIYFTHFPRSDASSSLFPSFVLGVWGGR